MTVKKEWKGEVHVSQRVITINLDSWSAAGLYSFNHRKNMYLDIQVESLQSALLLRSFVPLLFTSSNSVYSIKLRLEFGVLSFLPFFLFSPCALCLAFTRKPPKRWYGENVRVVLG